MLKKQGPEKLVLKNRSVNKCVLKTKVLKKPMCVKNQGVIKTFGFLESPRFVDPLLRAKREA